MTHETLKRIYTAARGKRHWIALCLVLLLLSSVISVGILGLVLDLLGGLIIISPYLNRLRKPLLQIPQSPFKELKKLEEYKDEIMNGQIRISSRDPEYEAMRSVMSQLSEPVAQTGMSFAIVLEPDESENWNVRGESWGGRYLDSYTFRGPPLELRRQIERAIEQKLLVIGGGLLVLGFSLQIIAQIDIGITSPFRVICQI